MDTLETTATAPIVRTGIVQAASQPMSSEDLADAAELAFMKIEDIYKKGGVMPTRLIFTKSFSHDMGLPLQQAVAAVNYMGKTYGSDLSRMRFNII